MSFRFQEPYFLFLVLETAPLLLRSCAQSLRAFTAVGIFTSVRKGGGSHSRIILVGLLRRRLLQIHAMSVMLQASSRCFAQNTPDCVLLEKTYLFHTSVLSNLALFLNEVAGLPTSGCPQVQNLLNVGPESISFACQYKWFA